MDWLQFLSSVIGSIAWPSAVVALAILMRTPLGKLLPLIRTLKYKDLQIDIGERLEAVREKVGAESEAPDIATEEPPLTFKKLAQADPRAAILSAWIPVEIELNEIAKKMNLQSRRGTLDMMRQLSREGVLDRLTSDTLDQLRRIRNTAVHVTEESVSFNDAIHMAEMCLWVNGQLKRISESMPAQTA
ncbi:hypothetical protein [Pseudomonas sp.]|uniref:hypothetical protein n=1 Tax=Pseudomonas sp. TaxID=306 RepID=UPI002619C2AF|nr:hypothetical protein [Pseudomonas sp.]